MGNQTQDSRILKRRIVAYGAMGAAAVLLIVVIILIVSAFGKPASPSSSPTPPATGTQQATTLEPTDVPTEEPTDPPTVPPVTETKMYVKINSGSINLREGQSADTAKLAEIAKGEIVTVLLYAEGADSWSQISYGDKTGYVKTSFLAELPRALDAAVNVEQSMNLRSEANTTSSVVATLMPNAKVTITQFTNSEWVKIVTEDGKVGYCKLRYLKDVA